METLLLTSTFEPVRPVGWQRAITLLTLGKVEVLEIYEDRAVRSVSLTMPMPSVARFLGGVRPRARVARFSRENVFLRDGGRCQYCGRVLHRNEATYDHVIPRSRGGRTNWTNIVIACLGCNQRKGGRTPEEARLRLRSLPTAPPARLGGLWLGAGREVPRSWRQYLVDFGYWNASLNE
ncbi:MAG: HNH endonuclease [Myxococcota bacterium]